MTATTSDIETLSRPGEIVASPVAADTKIPKVSWCSSPAATQLQ